MGKICDLCGNKTGWRGFRCADGLICKHCYKVVSNHFSTTIIQKTLRELKDSYQTNAAPVDLGEDGFFTTKKIGAFLLLDQQRHKFCLPGNPVATKQHARPEIYPYGQLQGYMLVTKPTLPPEKLATLSGEKKEHITIQYLAIRLRIAGVGAKDLVIIPSPVRSSSFAFRRAYRTATSVMRQLEEVIIC